VLVNVAGILLALIVLTALVFDYGVQFVGRNQAQNAADAAAHAAAVSLSYIDDTVATGHPLAQQAAVAAATQNQVWNAAPDVLTTDITFPACPPGAPGVAGTCVRAEVFRTNYNRGGGNPLPTFFAGIIGVANQGVRATATAQVLAGSGTADCVKPVAIPDRWDEFRPTTATWTTSSTFERYQQNGQNAGQLLNPADDYRWPTSGSTGSGFTLPTDYGVELSLKEGNPQDAIDPGFFYPILLDPGCTGGNCYRQAWEGCSTVQVGPGTVLNPEPGNMIGPTKQGVQSLIDQDPTSYWSTSANGGRGAPVGGCMAAGTCSRSPRWVAIPVFDVAAYDAARAIDNQHGRNTPITIVKVLGFWLDRIQGNVVYGRIMYYPTTSVTGTNNYPGAALLTKTIVLVR
jgi:Flp pilus assembly protein TadG